MIFKDYYKILGLETNRVSVGDIKNAYKEQAKKYHPDLNGGNKKFEERFKDINEAYNILSNPNTKRRYDRTWYTHVGKKTKNTYEQPKNNKEAIFTMFFGGSVVEKKQENKDKKEKSVRGENILTEIDLSIKEAFEGETKEIALLAVDGNMKKIKVDIPAGIQNGEKIRLIGQGKEGKNGGKNGDLYIKINIEDGKGGRGNLILDTKIMIPKHITEEEKELFEKMKKISTFNPRTIKEKI